MPFIYYSSLPKLNLTMFVGQPNGQLITCGAAEELASSSALNAYLDLPGSRTLAPLGSSDR